MNITDVGHLTSDADEGEDKIEKGAKREGKTAWEIAEFYTQAFKRDLSDLNIEEPKVWCKATDHIKEQIKLIKKLEKKGFVYKTVDGIYFDTSLLPDYGRLANLKNQELRAGVRVEVGDKKNITDFALWKFSPALSQRQMEWKSPWGVGFPGWHIECSAMSAKYLGQPFDIHCGGIDHVPVHHTNEIAQSEAAENKPLANYWLHGEFLLTNEAKMAKSEGNFLTLETIKAKGFSPLAYRYLLLQTHYRKQLNFSWEALEAAQNGLNRLYHTVSVISSVIPSEAEESLADQFTELVNNDLNLPEALALIWTSLKNQKISLKTVLLLMRFWIGYKNKIAEIKKSGEQISPEIKKLITERDLARKNKDWTKSDELRKKLEELGYEVKDNKIN